MASTTSQPSHAQAQVDSKARQTGWTALIILALLLMEWALVEALKIAPPISIVAKHPHKMAIYMRIFYVHVPAFMAGFTAFFVNFLASAAYLWKRSLKSDALAIAGAEVGVVFTSIGLITGPIWAKPIWGIWWTWDPRLTLTLVLWVMYVSYLMLRQLTPTNEQQPRLAAALAIFFFFDVPIDYMAIRWWRTQHPQPVLFGGANSGLDPRMATALWCGVAAFLLLAGLLFRLRYRLECDRQRIAVLRREAALRET